MAKGFFQVQSVASDSVRININGTIGDWGNSSEDVIWQIENQDVENIDVYIQSPGGSAFEGIAIYNALRNHPAKVTTHVLGAAASAGSIIFMAGDERVMPANTYLMIHEPSLRINGKAKELREAADFLDGMTGALLATYRAHVSIDESEILTMIQKESWIKAPEAVLKGFATRQGDAIEIVALAQDFTSRFESLPQSLTQNSIDDIVAAICSTKDLERALRESGCSKSLATALVSKAKTILQSESDSEAKAVFDVLQNFKLTLNNEV